MSGTVLIFGAGGFVGPWLAREFLSAGYRTVGCDLRASDAFPAGAEFRTADLLGKFIPATGHEPTFI